MKSKIKTEVHTHTIASAHAYSTVHEMITECARQKIELLAITDHGPALNGDGAHYWHFYNLRTIPRKVNGVYVVRGAEVNLLNFEGAVDLEDKYLQMLDWVIASVHNPCIESGTVKDHTQMYIKALENPLIDALGHSGTPNFSYDIDAVLETAKRLDKVIELNNHSYSTRPKSGENCKKIARRCAELGVLVSISTDAHSLYELGNTERVWEMAMDAGVKEDQIVNLTAERFLSYLCKRKNIDRAIFENPGF